MMGFDFFELVHSKDVPMVKTQLSTTASDSKEEKNESKMSSSLKDGMENSENLCPGAKRSFLCRMKKGVKAEDMENMGTKATIRKTKANVLVDEKYPVLSKFLSFFKVHIIYCIYCRELSRVQLYNNI